MRGGALRNCSTALVGFSTRHGGHQCRTTARTILRQHEVEADVRLHKLSDFGLHQIVEFRVETIHRTVNADLFGIT